VQALTDDFSVTYSTDVSVVRGEPPLRKIYPVRAAAAAALRALDIEVVREGSNFQVVR